MRCLTKYSIACVIAMMMSSHSFASHAQSHARWIFSTAFTNGGDKVGEIDFTTGTSAERTNISAGGNFIVSVGRIFPIGNNGLSVQTTIGWHWEGVTASNGDAGFDRFPIEIMPFYQYRQHRIGAGLSYGLSPTLDLTDAGGEKVKFNDTLGYVIEYDYMFNPEALGIDLILGFRYADINYKTDTVNGLAVTDSEEIDGRYAGIVFGMGF